MLLPSPSASAPPRVSARSVSSAVQPASRRASRASASKSIGATLTSESVPRPTRSPARHVAVDRRPGGVVPHVGARTMGDGALVPDETVDIGLINVQDVNAERVRTQHSVSVQPRDRRHRFHRRARHTARSPHLRERSGEVAQEIHFIERVPRRAPQSVRRAPGRARRWRGTAAPLTVYGACGETPSRDATGSVMRQSREVTLEDFHRRFALFGVHPEDFVVRHPARPQVRQRCDHLPGTARVTDRRHALSPATFDATSWLRRKTPPRSGRTSRR